jgi:hypothetical protein
MKMTLQESVGIQYQVAGKRSQYKHNRQKLLILTFALFAFFIPSFAACLAAGVFCLLCMYFCRCTLSSDQLPERDTTILVTLLF